MVTKWPQQHRMTITLWKTRNLRLESGLRETSPTRKKWRNGYLDRLTETSKVKKKYSRTPGSVILVSTKERVELNSQQCANVYRITSWSKGPTDYDPCLIHNLLGIQQPQAHLFPHHRPKHVYVQQSDQRFSSSRPPPTRAYCWLRSQGTCTAAAAPLQVKRAPSPVQLPACSRLKKALAKAWRIESKNCMETALDTNSGYPPISFNCLLSSIKDSIRALFAWISASSWRTWKQRSKIIGLFEQAGQCPGSIRTFPN